jgi:hypothetical protein
VSGDTAIVYFCPDVNPRQEQFDMIFIISGGTGVGFRLVQEMRKTVSF